MWEARNQPRTCDTRSRSSRSVSTGRQAREASVATKITFDKDKNQLELENYSSEPVRLNNVKVEK
jgi:hypothetical protein